MTRCLALALLAFIPYSVAGCTGSRSGAPYDSASAEGRNPGRADELNSLASDLILTEPEQAERLLREALSADLYHGPAHNNLGILHLHRGELYEAAHEFEWARKLLPGHPDPRLNLALTLEKAGHVDEALQTLDSALEVYPEHIPSMQARISLALRTDRTDGETLSTLRLLALRGENDTWRRWAQRQLSKVADAPQ